jgi:magnesium-protoporphyrin O-methyltransferase
MKQTHFDVHQHKSQLHSYFNGIGFERWSAIYGEDEDLSRIRLSIREGHAKTMSQAQTWLEERGLVARAESSHVLDAGCGTGLMSIALASQGFRVTSIDIAPQMVKEAKERAQRAEVNDRISFVAGDIETIGGNYDVVMCFDVLIHYPPPGFAPMCRRLAQSCRDTFIFTYAPHHPLLAMKHWIGGHFPKNQRRTEIQMIKRPFVEETLRSVGMKIQQHVRISHGFYHVALVEAVPMSR